MPPALSATTRPLRPTTAERLEALLTDLNPAEAAWISAYLAGFAAAASQVAPVFESVAAAPPPAAEPLTILFGSQTGHGAALAAEIAQRAEARGLPARVQDLAGFEPRQLKELRQLLLVISTHGEGQPPDPARGAVEFLLGRRAPRLEGSRFAVLGLGDSSYRHFCRTGRELDARLAELGAERLQPLFEGDVDYAATAPAWIEATLGAFAARLAPAGSGATLPATPAAAAPAPAALPSAAEPFPATLLERIRLTGRGSDKVVTHLELSLAGSGLSYAPGDALGVRPRNDPALVAELIATLHLDPQAPVVEGGHSVTLHESLSRFREITLATPRFVKAYAALASSRALDAVTEPEAAETLAAALHGQQIADLVRAYPAPNLSAEAFVATLRGLSPRLYSLASSPAAYPDEAHLTVAQVAFGPPERRRFGVTSGWLADRLAEDEPVPVHLSANPSFHLPPDPATPIILIGAGTGVAPFRAFLQHREALGQGGRAWLFFGERRFRTDFLYQVEWQGWLKSGILTRMDVAFSRDQASKIYVQHRLHQRARELYGWLQEGAVLYLCGDAQTLAPAVEHTLQEIIASEGGLAPEAAAQTLAQWQRDGRYRKDVY